MRVAGRTSGRCILSRKNTSHVLQVLYQWPVRTYLPHSRVTLFFYVSGNNTNPFPPTSTKVLRSILQYNHQIIPSKSKFAQTTITESFRFSFKTTIMSQIFVDCQSWVACKKLRQFLLSALKGIWKQSFRLRFDPPAQTRYENGLK